MAFQWPAGWVPFTQLPERLAAYKVTPQGNIEVGLDLTRELAGARLEAPTRGLVGSEELGEAMQGPIATEPSRPPPERHYPLPFEAYGRPAVRPIVIMSQEGPIEAPPRVRGPQKPYTRREFAVALIPRAAVDEYRTYLARLPTERRERWWYVWGAAWAIYLSEISSAPFGYFVQAAARGQLVYNIPEPRVTQTAYRPARVTAAQFSPVQKARAERPLSTPATPDMVLAETRGGKFCPVTFYTVGALIRYVQGMDLRNPDFDHDLRRLKWRVCDRIPRSGNGIWCPTRVPTQFERTETGPTTLKGIPLPSAENLGVAPPLQPKPFPRQRTL